MKSFGSDPEFMLMKDGEYYSAIAIVQGDITSRIEIEGHQFYWDNVLAECAIKASFSKEEAVENFYQCFKHYAELVKPYQLVTQASQNYPEKELLDFKCRVAGCFPDTCAYTLKAMMPPKGIIENTSFRTCGGHVHIGAEILQSDKWESIIGVRLFDLFLGIPSLFMDKDPTAAKRRMLYGQAGRFRPKPYGLEYRSLSNFWLASPKLVELIYDLSAFVVKFMDERKFMDIYDFDENVYYQDTENMKNAYKCKLFDDKEVQRVLDESDKNKAWQLYVLASKYLPKGLITRIKQRIDRKSIMNMYKEWGL